ncbi:hypothetical protein AVEN_130160-1, partial [Araneus ventricosus]
FLSKDEAHIRGRLDLFYARRPLTQSVKTPQRRRLPILLTRQAHGRERNCNCPPLLRNGSLCNNRGESQGRLKLKQPLSEIRKKNLDVLVLVMKSNNRESFKRPQLKALKDFYV